jgi:indolepyruvate ferredoxin oxidoreductase, beta subunit
MSKETTNVLMVGVGGQGIILASRILSQVVQLADYDLKMSEIHGMAQRGGSVVTHLRFGTEVHTPLIDVGQADYILASEKLEAWRWLPMLSPGGTVITSNQEIKPLPVIIGVQKYPAELEDKLQSLVGTEIGSLFVLDALGIARSCGQPKASNVVLCGLLCRQLGFDTDSCQKALEHVVPARFLTENIKAFEAGYHHSK